LVALWYILPRFGILSQLKSGKPWSEHGGDTRHILVEKTGIKNNEPLLSGRSFHTGLPDGIFAVQNLRILRHILF
jgi:hypothetical protein